MSLIFADGFEGYTSAEIGNYWTIDKIISNPSIISSPVHSGTGAMQPTAFGVQKPISSLQSFVLGFALYPSFNQQTIILKSISTATGTNTVLEFNLDGDGTFRLRREIGSATNIMQTSPKFAINCQPARYYYIEWTGAITNAALHEVRIDGNLAFSGTINAVGTNTTISNFNNVELFGNGNIFDDVYLASQDSLGICTPIGEVAIPALFPTADGSSTTWTPNSGTAHFSRVNEIPSNGDTSYCSSTGAGVIDTYKVSTSVINNTDIIPAAQLIQLTRDDGTAGTSTVCPYIIVNGATFASGGDNFAPQGSYVPNTKIYEQDPIAVAAWTGTKINQTEWGIDKV
jgi:hypothetical protein